MPITIFILSPPARSWRRTGWMDFGRQYDGTRILPWSARYGEIRGYGHLERVVLNDKFEDIRRERILDDLHQRVRDVRQGPDGNIYVLTDQEVGARLRIEPAVVPAARERARGPRDLRKLKLAKKPW